MIIQSSDNMGLVLNMLDDKLCGVEVCDITIKPTEGTPPKYYALSPGDEIALGIGNFKTTPRVGERYEDTPLKIIGINYLKNGELHEKKWWQFWIRKKRWIVILEMEQQGEVLNDSDKGYPVNMFVSHVSVSNHNAHIPD